MKQSANPAGNPPSRLGDNRRTPGVTVPVLRLPSDVVRAEPGSDVDPVERVVVLGYN